MSKTATQEPKMTKKFAAEICQSWWNLSRTGMNKDEAKAATLKQFAITNETFNMAFRRWCRDATR